MSDDNRMNTIIHVGPQGDIVLVGVSVDEARKNYCNKGGQDNGPCCLRRFYHKVGPVVNSQYDADIRNLKVGDYGNIEIQKLPIEKPILAKIQNVISDLINNNQVPFVFGGSKEAMVGSIYGFHKVYPQGQVLILSGMSHSKMYTDKLFSNNAISKIVKDIPEANIILFGCLQKYLPLWQSKNIKYITLEDIRGYKINKKQLGTLSQAGNFFRFHKWGEKLQIHISLEVIERFQGCRDILGKGLTVQQMLQIMYNSGLNKSVKLISISEFNPSCEDYQSSLLILNLLYYYLMGKSKE